MSLGADATSLARFPHQRAWGGKVAKRSTVGSLNLQLVQLAAVVTAEQQEPDRNAVGVLGVGRQRVFAELRDERD
jgi:hypothetical protein